MRPIWGLVIVILCLLIAVYVTVDYLMPNVICKMIPRASNDSHMGAYNSHVLSDICSGIR